jgi:hypothetical protein
LDSSRKGGCRLGSPKCCNPRQSLIRGAGGCTGASPVSSPTARTLYRISAALSYLLAWFVPAQVAAQVPQWGGSEMDATGTAEAGYMTAPPAGPVVPGEPPPAEQPAQSPTSDDPPLHDDEKRPAPDYDGREERATAGQALLWVPRVLLFPLYVVSEYAVRVPLGWLVTNVERQQLPALVVDFFTFGEERKAGVIPTGLIDLGFRPSFGLYFFWNDALAEDNEVRIRAATGGRHWWLLNVMDRYRFQENHQVFIRGELEIRPDWVFHGLGPSSPDEEFRYQKNQREAGIGYQADLWRSSKFESFVAIRDVDFDPSRRCCDDRSVAQALRDNRFPAPPGLDDGYTVLRQRLTATLDTREERQLDDPKPGVDFLSPPGTGAKLELRAEHAAGLRARANPLPAEPDYHNWIRYGGTLGGFVDFNGLQRVLGLEVLADFTDPLQENGEIPFSEQVTLGGDRPLRGFLEGRLIDRSSVAARLSYTWPVWVFLDGELFYALGNVFGPRLENFRFDLLRHSFGCGLRAAARRDHAFEILIAAGTETIEDGGQVENVRFVFGATSGF